MSWKENRRRKRRWYRYYREVCDRMLEVLQKGDRYPMLATELVGVMFDFNETRRLHKRKFIAESALESLRLAVQDTGLNNLVIKAYPIPGRPGPTKNVPRWNRDNPAPSPVRAMTRDVGASQPDPFGPPPAPPDESPAIPPAPVGFYEVTRAMGAMKDGLWTLGGMESVRIPSKKDVPF